MADDDRQPSGTEDRRLELPRFRPAFRRRRRTPGPVESAASSPDDTATSRVSEPVDGPDLSPGPVGLPESRPEVTSPLLTAPAEEAPRQPRRLHLHVPAPLAAALTGVVVGLALVGLTAGSLHLCSSMRGTSSCGKPGILLLLAITAIAILLGTLMLRVAGVAAPGSTSFLGVGLVVVLVLLALLGVLDEWWVVVVVPALAMVTHVAAWWLTSTYSEPGVRPPRT